MTTQTIANIIADHDAGFNALQIAARHDVSIGYVYQQLRKYRPNRKRKPRERTSNKPAKIRALYAVNKSAARTAKLVKCSRAYVYQCLE